MDHSSLSVTVLGLSLEHTIHFISLRHPQSYPGQVCINFAWRSKSCSASPPLNLSRFKFCWIRGMACKRGFDIMKNQSAHLS